MNDNDDDDADGDGDNDDDEGRKLNMMMGRRTDNSCIRERVGSKVVGSR